METARDILKKIRYIKLKTRGSALVVFLRAVAIGAVCTAVYASIFASRIIQWGHWDDSGLRKIVFEIFSLAAIMLVLGWSNWRLARTCKRAAADAAKTKEK